MLLGGGGGVDENSNRPASNWEGTLKMTLRGTTMTRDSSAARMTTRRETRKVRLVVKGPALVLWLGGGMWCKCVCVLRLESDSPRDRRSSAFLVAARHGRRGAL